MAKRGRPTLYTPELLERICDRLRKGEPLAAICRDAGMPHPSTIWDWAEKDEQISQLIARARNDGEDAIAAECFEIADDSRNDFMERLAKEGDPKAMEFNGEHVQRSKLRIETRLKLLAKFNPKRWGERQQIDHGVTGTLEQLVLQSMPAALPAPTTAAVSADPQGDDVE